MPNDTPNVLILAAGLGKRMKSPLPKVLQTLGGQPLLFHILDTVFAAFPQASVGIVVGYGREEVEKEVRASEKFSSKDIHFIHQPEQLGTGHAARCAMESSWGVSAFKSKRSILVLPGDQPLITAELVQEMAEPLSRSEVMRMLTCEVSDPKGYGRVVRRGKTGPVLRIVEEKDANLREKAIREIATSVYLFQSAFLKAGLARLSNKNAQSEYYLTDLVAQAASAKKKVSVYPWANCEDLKGINDQWELAQAATILNRRVIKKWAIAGVKMIAPETIWIGVEVELSPEVLLESGVILRGKTKIDRGARIGAYSVLTHARVGEFANIKVGCVIEESEVGPRTQVGPYAHFRPGTVVGRESKIGNFVELKKTLIGERTSVAHLSYLGDAEVGQEVNVGCGFVTCNYDGRVIDGSRKHKTIIEDGAFVGSDVQAIAPVRIGKGAYIASGSTVTQSVPAGDLAIARSRQVNKPGYAKKFKKES